MDDFASLETKALKIYEFKTPEQKEQRYKDFKDQISQTFLNAMAHHGTGCVVMIHNDGDIDLNHHERLQQDLAKQGYQYSYSLLNGNVRDPWRVQIVKKP